MCDVFVKTVKKVLFLFENMSENIDFYTMYLK